MIASQSTGVWLLLGAVGVGTYLIRYSFIGILGRAEVSERVQRLLRYVPPAALAALVVPGLLFRGDNPGLTIHNYRLLAGLLAATVAWKTRSILATIATGMSALWLLQWLF